MSGSAALPLMHQPGERWLYHTGSDVLGVLIARAAGPAAGAFLRERIFEPLGMKDTGFSVPAAKLDRLATPLRDRCRDRRRSRSSTTRRGGRWASPPAFESGGGGLVSTVDDYLAFGRMMLNNGQHGGERILSRPSVELMTTDQLTPEQKAGVRRSSRASGTTTAGASAWPSSPGATDLAARPGRFGWDGGYGTSWYVDPNEEHGRHPDDPARLWTRPARRVYRDFWTSAYQAIDD